MEDMFVIRMLRSLSMLDPSRRSHPEIGDLILERSRFRPDPTMLGILREIVDDPQEGRIYLVDSWTGEKQRWINSDATTVITMDRNPVLPAPIAEFAE